MNRWFASPLRKKGWLAVELENNAASYVHGRTGEQGAKPVISFFGRRSIETDADFARLAKDLQFSRFNCLALLQADEYRLIQLEAPNVPAAERKAALRWRLKDLLDFPPEEATFDVLDIPSGAGAAAARPASVYAVAARSELIRSRVGRFERAKVPLSVVDIRETAQRNIAARREDADRGLALLFSGDESSLLTVNFKQELILARRIEIGSAHFSAPGNRGDSLERLGLEIQRTLDLVDRQFPFVTIAKLLVAPQPDHPDLAESLKAGLGLRIEPLDLADVFDFESGPVPDAAEQWRLFHLLGAALRE